ncbi:Ribosome biogenesis protein brx1 [Dispira simplex]|nr:Ribosome biogenesis protein brx1 [Dispira simplex]
MSTSLKPKKVATEQVANDSPTDNQSTATQKPVVKNKQRVLLLSSRGITYRHRHLMQDILTLLPHAKKDNKLDSKSNLGLLNELAEVNNCNNALYFEARRKTDLYLWASKTPNGPSAKFLVQNIHTMEELNLTGNCLKGSRHLLSFDRSFDTKPHLQLLKQLFIHSFGVPKGTRRSKPFVDHILTFSLVDNCIWFRNFQIVEKDPATGGDHQKETSLVEVGPRFVLKLIKIFEGSFRGATLYENPDYFAEAAMRRYERQMAKVQRHPKR